MKSIFDAEVAAEIRTRISSVLANDTAKFGRMTSVEMLCHLYDSLRASQSEEIAAGYRTSFMSNPLTRWLVISSPVPWPKGKIKVPAEFSKYFFHTKVDDSFSHHKQELLDEFEKIASGSVRMYCHPIFGELTQRQWGELHYRHCDHHLGQFGR